MRRLQAPLVRYVALLALLAAIGENTITSGLFASPAGDWPTYLHDQRRQANNTDETGLSVSNAAQLVKLWSFQTADVVAASATVVNNVVYFGSWDGNEYALDATSGTLLWKTFLGLTSTTNCNLGTTGITSAATVQNGLVYVGGGDSYWYALDAATGNVLWRVFTGDNTTGYYNWSSPLIYNGFAYIGIASYGDCPLTPGQLLQVDLTTHQVVNTFNVVPQGENGGGIWTSPSVDPQTNTIYVTTGTKNSAVQVNAQSMVALDASTLAFKSGWQVITTVSDADWGTTPLVYTAGGRTMVAATNKDGIAYGFDASNVGAGPVWQQQIARGGTCPPCGDGSVSSPALGQGLLYMAGGGTSISGSGTVNGSVRALDPATGNIVWQHAANGVVIAALAYANGLVVDGAGPTVEVLNGSDGSVLFSYPTGGSIYGAASVSNGRIFVGSHDGKLYAFGLSGPPTPTSSATPTVTGTPPTSTPTRTPTNTPSPTPTGTSTLTPTATPTATPTSTGSTAPALVQSNVLNVSSGTSGAVKYTSSVTTGNLLVAAVRIGNSAGRATVSDNNGNAWRLIDQRSDGGGGSGEDLELWYAMNASPSPNVQPTVTVRSSVAASIRGVVAEFSNVPTSGALDQHATAIGTSNALSVTTAGPMAQGNELVLGYGEVENSSTFTPSASSTLVGVVPSGSGAKLALEYQVTSAVGTPSAGFGVSGQAWAMGIATFR